MRSGDVASDGCPNQALAETEMAGRQCLQWCNSSVAHVTVYVSMEWASHVRLSFFFSFFFQSIWFCLPRVHVVFSPRWAVENEQGDMRVPRPSVCRRRRNRLTGSLRLCDFAPRGYLLFPGGVSPVMLSTFIPSTFRSVRHSRKHNHLAVPRFPTLLIAIGQLTLPYY